MSDFTGVHKANPFNSTDFTDCCDLAVLAVLKQDEVCPGCKKSVLRFVKQSN